MKGTSFIKHTFWLLLFAVPHFSFGQEDNGSDGACPASFGCRAFFGLLVGYEMQSTNLFTGRSCQTSCVPTFFAWINLLWGWAECGPCDDDNVPVVEVPNQIIDRADVEYLASDELGGRDNNSTGSALAQNFLVQELQAIGAVGLNDLISGTGSDSYLQRFDRGTNVLGVLKGTDELADEYVVVGAHYDHVSFCSSALNADSDICNGATDNAAGVALVLGIARALSVTNSTLLRRSIVFAFWDREEDGLLGSDFFTNNNPLIPMDKIVGYLNYDIMGANLMPSLRSFTTAVASETGGPNLQRKLANAVADEGLNVVSFSSALGQFRSDYTNFVNNGVPTIFFSDSTGGCYHTSGDEVKVVDFVKLNRQARIGFKLTVELATTTTPPNFATSLLPATYDDAVGFLELGNTVVENDLNLFGPTEQAEIAKITAELNRITAPGPLVFPLYLLDFASVAQSMVAIVTSIECDGFLE